MPFFCDKASSLCLISLSSLRRHLDRAGRSDPVPAVPGALPAGQGVRLAAHGLSGLCHCPGVSHVGTREQFGSARVGRGGESSGGGTG